jgi:uncharacterized protein Usg
MENRKTKNIKLMTTSNFKKSKQTTKATIRTAIFVGSIVTILITLNSYAQTATNSSTIKSKSFNKNKTEIMDGKDFTSSILVDQTPATAFNAIKNFRAWWSEEIEGKTDQLNETFFYHYKDVHLCKIKLLEIIPDKKLVYQVVDNQFNFVKDKTEWINTKMIFDITRQGGKTKVIFTHQGLVPEYECYNVCNDAWSGYIQGSLQSLITTGKGKPNGKEGGLNAELVEKWGLPDKSNNMKQEKDFTTSILVDKSPKEVFNAINNVRGWWQGEITGSTDKLNDEFTYQMKEFHLTKQKIVEFVPNKKVVWQVTESKINFVADKEEWLNSKIIFDITTEGKKTKLTFTHHGLVPKIECYRNCSGAWDNLIEKSLFSLITTGKGIDVF